MITSQLQRPACSGRGRLILGRRAVITLALSLCVGASSHAQTGFPSGCAGYCGNGIGIGVGVAAGAIAGVGILLAVNHDHHTLKGCVSTGPNGPQLQTSDSKTYALEGDASVVKVGNILKFHGSRAKKTKDSNGNPVFKVEKLKKDYGPCHAAEPPARGGS